MVLAGALLLPLAFSLAKTSTVIGGAAWWTAGAQPRKAEAGKGGGIEKPP